MGRQAHRRGCRWRNEGERSRHIHRAAAQNRSAQRLPILDRRGCGPSAGHWSAFAHHHRVRPALAGEIVVCVRWGEGADQSVRPSVEHRAIGRGVTPSPHYRTSRVELRGTERCRIGQRGRRTRRPTQHRRPLSDGERRRLVGDAVGIGSSQGRYAGAGDRRCASDNTIARDGQPRRKIRRTEGDWHASARSDGVGESRSDSSGVGICRVDLRRRAGGVS